MGCTDCVLLLNSLHSSDFSQKQLNTQSIEEPFEPFVSFELLGPDLHLLCEVLGALLAHPVGIYFTLQSLIETLNVGHTLLVSQRVRHEFIQSLTLDAGA